jgi:hypothetical protein
MIELGKLSISELAAVICEALKKADLEVTLSGGACAEIYSNGEYVTGDIDFIMNTMWPENLSLLSPTDAAKDRLAGYFHGNDLQCLEQAVMICKRNKVNMKNIRSWAKNEGSPEKFREFERKMAE